MESKQAEEEVMVQKALLLHLEGLAGGAGQALDLCSVIETVSEAMS